MSKKEKKLLTTKKIQQDLERVKESLEEKQKEFALMQRAFATVSSKLNILQEIHQLMGYIFDLDLLLDKIMEVIIRVMDIEAASLLLIDEGKEELYFKVAKGPKGEAVKDFRLKIGEGIAGWVVMQNESVAISDVGKDPRFKKDISESIGFEVHSLLCVPLRARGKVIGVIEVLNKSGKENFVADDIDLLTAIAQLVGPLIGNLSLFRKRREKIKRKIKKIKDKL